MTEDTPNRLPTLPEGYRWTVKKYPGADYWNPNDWGYTLTMDRLEDTSKVYLLFFTRKSLVWKVILEQNIRNPLSEEALTTAAKFLMNKFLHETAKEANRQEEKQKKEALEKRLLGSYPPRPNDFSQGQK